MAQLMWGSTRLLLVVQVTQIVADSLSCAYAIPHVLFVAAWLRVTSWQYGCRFFPFHETCIHKVEQALQTCKLHVVFFLDDDLFFRLAFR